MKDMNIPDLNSLKRQVAGIMDHYDYVSDALKHTRRLTGAYFVGRPTPLINEGIMSDAPQVIAALEQDLRSYKSSFARGNSHDTRAIQRTTRRIDRVRAAARHGYDMFDTSDDVDHLCVIDKKYVLEVIDYYDSYYSFMAAASKDYEAKAKRRM